MFVLFIPTSFSLTGLLTGLFGHGPSSHNVRGDLWDDLMTVDVNTVTASYSPKCGNFSLLGTIDTKIFGHAALGLNVGKLLHCCFVFEDEKQGTYLFIDLFV